uniref:Uncharacterized protein n=1 Tax=Prunus persica TaxID=3760 RepID=A6XN20_PRUPE|nr:hypothetical protein [Prunus persica]
MSNQKKGTHYTREQENLLCTTYVEILQNPIVAQQQPHHSTTGFAAQPHGYSNVIPVLEQIHSLPPLRSHSTYAPVYASNGALAHMPLGPMHNALLDPRSQVDLNSRVDQLTQKVDDQNNLIGQLLRQINLNQGPNLGPRDEEMRAHQHVDEQFERSQAGQTRANRQRRYRDQVDETQTAASRTLSRSGLEPRTNVLERLGPQTNVHARLGPQTNVHARLGPQGARVREQSRDERNDRRPPTCSRANMRQQAVEGSFQAQSPNLPHGQGTQGDRPLGTEEGVSQSRPRHQRRRPERPSLQAEDDNRRPPTCSRTNTRRQDVEESSQAQSPKLPHGQNTQGDRPLGTDPVRLFARTDTIGT